MREKTITNRTNTISKYFNEVNKTELLTIEEETALANRIMDGDKTAIDELVKANLKFVISVAKEFQGLGLTLADLISEGNLGLIKSAERFDPSRGFRFISYAVYWIRQTIMHSLNENSRMIRLPANVITKINKLKKSNLTEIDAYVNDSKVYPSCISINTLIGEGEDIILGDVLIDETANEMDVLDHEIEKLKEVVNKTLECLNERERGIIECYFGLNSHCGPMTLEAIGDRYNLTKERIRQIKEKAIRRLKHNNIEVLSVYNS